MIFFQIELFKYVSVTPCQTSIAFKTLGSIISQLLFLIMINDLPAVPANGDKSVCGR